MPRQWHNRKSTPAAPAASRKPLLFRLSGSFLLRYAARQLSGLLFQLPPRNTRELIAQTLSIQGQSRPPFLVANRGFAPVPQEG